MSSPTFGETCARTSLQLLRRPPPPARPAQAQAVARHRAGRGCGQGGRQKAEAAQIRPHFSQWSRAYPVARRATQANLQLPALARASSTRTQQQRWPTARIPVIACPPRHRPHAQTYSENIAAGASRRSRATLPRDGGAQASRRASERKATCVLCSQGPQAPDTRVGLFAGLVGGNGSGVSRPRARELKGATASRPNPCESGFFAETAPS